MGQERLGAGAPTEALGVGAAGFAVGPQRRQRGRAQVRVDGANAAHGAGQHIARPGDVERSHRGAAGQRLQDDEAECVGQAREDEDVAAGIGGGELRAVTRAGEVDRGMGAAQCGELRAAADHYLGARQVEVEKGADILLHRNPADIGEHRARQIPGARRQRAEQVQVDPT